MAEEDLQPLLKEMHSWTDAYMKTFHTDDEEVMLGIRIKETHTGYVTSIARELAKHLELNAHDVQLAEVMGLFHDVGRFRQYSLYQTFNDSQSEDHADLGLKVLDELDLMKRLAPEDEALVRFAIKNHNKKVIEPTDNKRKLLFAKLLRDADKLDIYRVLTPYLDNEDAMMPKFVKNTGEHLVSEGFVKDFADGNQVDYYRITTQGDRVLVRLMWVYDINFAWTLKKVVEKGYVDAVVAHLPVKEQPELKPGFDRMYRYIEEKCKTKDAADIY